MEKTSTIEIRDGYMVVTAYGDRNDFKAIMEGTQQISDAAEARNLKYVLADYRNIKFNRPLSDAFNLVKLYEQKVPAFRSIVISAVTTIDNLEIAEFWESICNRRGYQYKVFTDFDKAERWLTDLICEHKSSS